MFAGKQQRGVHFYALKISGIDQVFAEFFVPFFLFVH